MGDGLYQRDIVQRESTSKSSFNLPFLCDLVPFQDEPFSLSACSCFVIFLSDNFNGSSRNSSHAYTS